MDPFSSLLGTPRARDAFALRASLSAPWSLEVLAGSPLTLLAVVRGQAWIGHGEDEPVRLGVGEVAIARGPDSYSISDDPSTATTVVIHPGQRCCTPEGEPLTERLMLGVRTWGNDPDGETLMLVGVYEEAADVSARLLRALPPVLSLKHPEWDSPLIGLLCDEMGKDVPGQAAVLDRLLDLLLTAVLRTWLARPDDGMAARYPAQADPVVSRALQMLHRDPAHAWTLASLAKGIGVSRAALARRFQEVVGQSPMAFLTEWRLARAADLLCEPNETIGSVAAKVGYSTPYSLSSAFKRVRGVSPREHRERAKGLAGS